jgi:hypothetical protein
MSAWDYWTKPDRHLGELFVTDLASFSSRSFRRIGHTFVAMLAATLGGVFVRWRYEEHSTKDDVPQIRSSYG